MYFNWKRILPRIGWSNRYLGLTSGEWEKETSRWEWGGSFGSNKIGCWTFWGRPPTLIESWLERVGLPPTQRYNLRLLQGDTKAVPVLIDLLLSDIPQTRQIAAQAIQRVGEKAQDAIPILLLVINDKNETVRAYARQALFYIDRTVAEKAGLEW